jgi:rhamnosyltransferase
MNSIDVSVIIPVKNGQRYLDSVLKAVFSQEINAKFEVIIVDSGSTDKTLDIITQYPVRYYQIRETEFNHGVTRNFAISKSQGKYIILMTADAIPYNNRWMERLVSNLERDQSAAGVYSRQIPHIESHPLTQIRVNRLFTSNKKRRESQIDKIADYENLSPREKHMLCNFDNVSSCIRKDVWGEIPFPKTDFAEDLEWSKSVLGAGYKIIYEPDSIVYHSHDFSIFDWYKKNRINFNKLSALFGLNTINNVYRLLAFFFIYTLRDIYFLYKDKRRFTTILSNIHLIPLYSFFGTLGQYIGIKDAFRSQ